MQSISGDGKQAIEMAVHTLDEGGVVMHPTETCYGLAVDIFNENSLSKLYHIKDMRKTKPVSILVDSLEMAQDYGHFSEKALELAVKHWPGPLSIVVPRKDTLPDFLNPGMKFVSIRCSSLKFCRDMVEKFSQPVTTTSANVSGQPPLYRPEKLGGVDLLINVGEVPGNKPSTIVRVNGDKVEVLREGDVLI